MAARLLAWGALVVCAAVSEVLSETNCDLQLEETLRTLLDPQENGSIQVQALRRELLKKLQDALQEIDMEDQKRSLASLAAWNNLPESNKRSLESLARAGYLKTLPDEDDEDQNYKRSIANLAKNGQLPVFQREEQKRGIEALARNGDLRRRQDLQDLLNEIYDKRNIGSLARSYNFPNNYGKRSISSLARSGDLPYALKRNIAALARDGQLVGKRPAADFVASKPVEASKRNLQSVKAQGYKPKFKRSVNDTTTRPKRQTDYLDEDNADYASGYQLPTIYDYDDILQDLNNAIAQQSPEKRFLGRLPQMGKPRTTPFPKTRRYH